MGMRLGVTAVACHVEEERGDIEQVGLPGVLRHHLQLYGTWRRGVRPSEGEQQERPRLQECTMSELEASFTSPRTALSVENLLEKSLNAL